MHDTTIEAPVPADIPFMAALSEQLGYPILLDDMIERATRLSHEPAHFLKVAHRKGIGVVGWIHAMEQEPIEVGRRVEIMGLVVDSAYHGSGTGRLLVDAANAWAAGRGIDVISVRSNVVRGEAHRFYERLGFVREKSQHAFRRAVT